MSDLMGKTAGERIKNFRNRVGMTDLFSVVRQDAARNGRCCTPPSAPRQKNSFQRLRQRHAAFLRRRTACWSARRGARALPTGWYPAVTHRGTEGTRVAEHHA
jgi:hypothetical protein